MAGEPRVADMNISDEHFIVEAKTSMKQVAEILLQDHKAAILVRDRKEERIVSALNAADLIDIVADGGKPGSIKAIDIGREDLMFLPAAMMLSEAITVMRERMPEAVIIVDDAGDPVGYFSPDDYGDAVSKIDQHRKRLEAVQHSVDNTPGPSNDLLDALEEDNDAEDEDEVELPEDPFNASDEDEDDTSDESSDEGSEENDPADNDGFEEMSDEPMSDAERLMSSMRARARGDVDDLEEQVVQSEPEAEPDDLGGDEQALEDVGGHLIVEHTGIETDDDFGGPEDVGGGDEQALEDIGGHLFVEHTGIETDDGGGFSVDDILNENPEQEVEPAPVEPTRKVKGPPKRPHRAHQGATATLPRRVEPEDAAPAEPEVAPEPAPQPAVTDTHDYNEEADDETWQLLRDSTDPYDFEFYIEHFPKGKYVVPAKLKLKQLQRRG
ncbi:MAG TPA: hypothetical protein QF646_07700 [Candidatus Poseidoniales archaeon]|nr:hypothetical protein [Candidatus Poseidoniales archaeon]